MIKITIQHKGLDELIKNLSNPNVRQEFVEAANRAVTEVQKYAIAEVPVKTGALQQSHILSPATMNVARAEVYTDKEYAVPVHEGHRIVAWGHDTGRRKAPNPWMKRAAERAESIIDKIFSDAGDQVARILTK